MSLSQTLPPEAGAKRSCTHRKGAYQQESPTPGDAFFKMPFCRGPLHWNHLGGLENLILVLSLTNGFGPLCVAHRKTQTEALRGPNGDTHPAETALASHPTTEWPTLEAASPKLCPTPSCPTSRTLPVKPQGPQSWQVQRMGCCTGWPRKNGC